MDRELTAREKNCTGAQAEIPRLNDESWTASAVIERAVSSGVERYIASRLEKIPAFVARHYSFRGALQIHALAIGWDLVRVPLNILWSVVNLLLACFGLLAKVFGLRSLSRLIAKVPQGLETDMDRQIKWLVVSELLEMPCSDGSRESARDALMEAIMNDPQLADLIERELVSLGSKADSMQAWRDVDAKLAEYGATRTGTADLASNVMVVLSSKMVLGKASYGALGAGSAVSAALANSVAASNFWLGSTLGAYYYAIFPAAVSTPFLIVVTTVLVISLALATTFIGMITDPLQARLGVHQRRLRKLVKAVELDLKEAGPGKFQLREKYVGRILDIVDFLSLLGKST